MPTGRVVPHNHLPSNCRLPWRRERERTCNDGRRLACNIHLVRWTVLQFSLCVHSAVSPTWDHYHRSWLIRRHEDCDNDMHNSFDTNQFNTIVSVLNTYTKVFLNFIWKFLQILFLLNNSFHIYECIILFFICEMNRLFLKKKNNMWKALTFNGLHFQHISWILIRKY